MYKHLLILILLCCGAVIAQPVQSDFPDYTLGTRMMTATPGTQNGAVGAYWNPAAWAAMRGQEIAFTWNDSNVTPKRMDNWGLHLGGKGIGFVVRRNNFLGPTKSLASNPDSVVYPQRRVDDYQIALSGGRRDDFWGLSYGWSKGDTDAMPRSHYLTLGNISRPSRRVSLGNAFTLGLSGGDFRNVTDLGVRPFATHRLTLFADAAYGRKDNTSTMHWGVGAEVMPLDGIRIAAKLSKPAGRSQDKIYSLSLGFAMGGEGFHVIPHYDKDSEHLSTSYMIRVGDQAPSFRLSPLLEGSDQRVVSMTMKGRLTYQKSKWFDADRHTLLEILNTIERARTDKRVDGIALNLSGFTGNRAMFWEIRQELQEFRATGKRVYIYIDRAGMSLYNLASVADFLWMDPLGSLTMPGYLSGRTFWKGFLEKLGLGVEEWRYFDYKSAFETLARREMSEKAREQSLQLIEDYYSQWSADIEGSRDLQVDLRQVVDSVAYITAEEALDLGLVDTLGRRDDAVDFIEEFTGDDLEFIGTDDVNADRFADQSWGALPKIAVVYALGECDMDAGIRARYTSRLLRKLAANDDIDAVVLRVDSPGGDALASDLVAEQMVTVSESKPMIVSQGRVAASGGYWLSYNGDRVFTSPYSITGSIGVIGGWIWNQGLTDKTGFTSDFVKVGEHADLGFGIRLPLIGATVPDRKLNEYEKARVEKIIRGLYRDFVSRVAESRGLDTAYVESLAQGRVWSGTKSVENKLTDELGSLTDAIDFAKQQSGHKKRREVQIVEYPRPSWLNLNRLFAPARPFGILFGVGASDGGTDSPAADADYELSVLRRVAEHPAQPLMMIPPEDIPLEDGR